MEKTDSGQKWSEMGAGTKGKTIKEEEKQPSLIQRVERMVSVTELLLETLADLSHRELQIFKDVLRLSHIHGHKSRSPEMLSLQRADQQNIVFLMVQTYGQMSVVKTSRILRKMRRTDLVQRLSDSNSGPKKKLPVDEHLSALIHKVATLRAVKDLLLKTLNDLSHEELENFRWFLQFRFFQRSRPQISWRQLQGVDSGSDMVDVVVDMCGQQSVEVMKEVLMDMKRTDLVQRLSEACPGSKAAGSSAEASGVNTEEGEKQSLDERWPALKQKVETMASVTELLLETLADLSDRELQIFQDVLRQFHIRHRDSVISDMLSLKTADKQNVVFLMVQTYGQTAVEKTKEILKEMMRTDLVQRLSDSNSGPQKKLPVDEHLSALIHKVATLRAVKDLLLETLSDLSHEEQENFRWFLQFRFFQRSRPQISWRRLQGVDSGSDMVDVVVDTCGQQSVEVMKEVLMDMKRTDLVQRLSEACPGSKAAGSSAEASGVNTEEGEKQSLDERWPALKQKVETMASVTELLLETLADLSDRELQIFQDVLRRFHIRHWDSVISDMLSLKTADKQNVVFLMVQTYGQTAVEKTKEILKEMMRTDLVQRLSDSNSGPQKKLPVDEHLSALIHKVATVAAVKDLLLETLSDLSHKELENFRWFLQFSVFQRSRPQISWRGQRADSGSDMVDVMVDIYGQQSVEVMKEVLMDMNRTDLVQRLSESSPRPKGPSGSLGPEACGRVEVHPSIHPFSIPLIGRVKDSSDWTKLEPEVYTGADEAPIYSLQSEAGRFECSVSGLRWVCEAKISFKYQFCSWEEPMERMESLRYMPAGPLMDITVTTGKLNEVYLPHWIFIGIVSMQNDNLQSEAGRFECSVSGLRWVCEAKISFKYQFCSWEEPMERMESLRYMPAGPLMDITVTTGKLNEVYLPHWIFIEDNPKISDKFAVLHIDDCGDVVEKVSEVTASHVKLFESVFSPRAVLMKAGFPVKIKCNVLIYYKPNTPFLKLHVFLIPHDHHLQQTVDKKKFSEGYQKIQKPRPDKYLKMQQRFCLTSDKASAKILPEKMTLRYDSQDPNFYEVFIKNPDTEFHLMLLHTNSGEPVWTCEIRRDDYQTSVHLEEDSHSVDEFRTAPIQNVTITTHKEKILKMLGDLKQDEVKGFKWFLQDSDNMAGLPHIPRSRLGVGDIYDLVDLLLQTYNQQSVEVTKKLLKKINRNDLAQML